VPLRVCRTATCAVAPGGSWSRRCVHGHGSTSYWSMGKYGGTASGASTTGGSTLSSGCPRRGGCDARARARNEGTVDELGPRLTSSRVARVAYQHGGAAIDPTRFGERPVHGGGAARVVWPHVREPRVGRRRRRRGVARGRVLPIQHDADLVDRRLVVDARRRRGRAGRRRRRQAQQRVDRGRERLDRSDDRGRPWSDRAPEARTRRLALWTTHRCGWPGAQPTAGGVGEPGQRRRVSRLLEDRRQHELVHALVPPKRIGGEVRAGQQRRWQGQLATVLLRASQAAPASALGTHIVI